MDANPDLVNIFVPLAGVTSNTYFEELPERLSMEKSGATSVLNAAKEFSQQITNFLEAFKSVVAAEPYGRLKTRSRPL
jgi:hypothetical protein